MTVLEIYDYLMRARRDLWAALREAPDAVLSQSLLSGDRFHSIKDLVMHIAVTEDFWIHEDIFREPPRLESIPFAFRFTPKHGSWLNVQEIEWSALERQALAERLGDKQCLERAVDRWLDDRRERAVTINCQFTTSDACLNLQRLCPEITG